MLNQFCHIGMGTVVQRARILLITNPQSTSAKRYVEGAKQLGKFYNAAMGHRQRSVLLLDDGTVIISTIKPFTLMKRLNMVEGQTEPDADDAADEAEEMDPATTEESEETHDNEDY